ncbi:MAG: sigma-54 dependent transcriptional regulator [Deltaproteobacteria bacterium]
MADAAARSDASPPRVLVAEDDERLARLVAARLVHGGFEVDCVSDGLAALETARQHTHGILVLDYHLPKLDGIGVLEALDGLEDRPAVILMSGFLDVEQTLEALRLGAAEVLEKPFDPARLCEVVRSVELRANDATQDLVADASVEYFGASAHARAVRDHIVAVSQYPELPVLIVGDTGTGKEVVAKSIHAMRDGDDPFVAMNCAAITDELFESELFGHEAGAFTGAGARRVGLLESAKGGTVFLDEIGEMPLTQQAKLLRVLEDRSFRPVGSNREVPLRARIVSATNRVVSGEQPGVMRSDLFFRLAGYTIRLEPLNTRREDITVLAERFVQDFIKRYASSDRELSALALDVLRMHDWPGNARELRAVIQFACILATDGVIGVRHVIEALRSRGVTKTAATAEPTDRGDVGLREMERQRIATVYAECRGNASRAARKLGIPRSTLRDKLERYGIS